MYRETPLPGNFLESSPAPIAAEMTRPATAGIIEAVERLSAISKPELQLMDEFMEPCDAIYETRWMAGYNQALNRVELRAGIFLADNPGLSDSIKRKVRTKAGVIPELHGVIGWSTTEEGCSITIADEHNLARSVVINYSEREEGEFVTLASAYSPQQEDFAESVEDFLATWAHLAGVIETTHAELAAVAPQ